MTYSKKLLDSLIPSPTKVRFEEKSETIKFNDKLRNKVETKLFMEAVKEKNLIENVTEKTRQKYLSP